MTHPAFENDPIRPDADGGFSVSYRIPTTPALIARWYEDTGEFTLSRETRLVVWTKNPDAFVAAVRLLGAGSVVVYDGFCMMPTRLPGETPAMP